MSHEGIRLVNAEEAHQEPETVLPREAVTPVKVRVLQSAGEGLEIVWKDGHSSRWSFAWLRNACPCATCHEEREAQGREPGHPPAKAAALLPMYQEPARPTSSSPVGNYALSFQWNDGHGSGIYSWEYLRRNCQCSACRS